MNHYFWQAITLHYFAISMAVLFNDPAMAAISFMTFALIPTLADVELIPGMEKLLETQIEILKTQHWLGQRGYY